MYGKYFASTFTGSMVGAGPCTFAVWGYVIANCKNGTVEINPTVLGAILGTTKEEVEMSIEYLSSPDPASRSKIAEGRRLVKVGAFFYEVPNHASYRAITSDEERREYFRDKKREQREREANAKGVKTKRKRLSLTVKDKSPESNLSTQSEADAYADTEGEEECKKPELKSAMNADDLEFSDFPEPELVRKIVKAYPSNRKRDHLDRTLAAIRRAVVDVKGLTGWDDRVALNYLLNQTISQAGRWTVLGTDPQFIPAPDKWFDAAHYDDDQGLKKFSI